MMRSERGSATVEVVGMLPYLFMAALLVWEMLLIAAVATSAENAARTGSRSAGLGKDGRAAAIESLSPWMQKGASARINGERAEVTVRVPLIVPWVSIEDLTVTRRAELPEG